MPPDRARPPDSRDGGRKQEQGPEGWKSPDEGYWCRYAVDWTEIKARWTLTMTEPEGRRWWRCINGGAKVDHVGCR